MVFTILKQTGMMRLVIQFTSDTDIKPKLVQARDFAKMLDEIPLKTLLDATTFAQIAEAIKKILGQLKRARMVGTYPLNRALDLCELIAKDFDDQIKKVLNQQPILLIDYQDYRTL